MGIDYSFQLYVHRDHVVGFLAAVAALCDPHGDEQTTVIVPDGTVMRLPGSYGWKAGRTEVLTDVVADRYASSFDLSLCFPQDDRLRSYLDSAAADHRDVRCPWPDGTTRVRVALVYLGVSDGSSLLPEHWMFDFTPATSEQSRLFLTSPTIRQTFATLALNATSPLCLLDVEELFSIVVTGPRQQVSVQVPGPCLLWDRRAPKHQAYRELLARLSASAPSTRPKWIIGPGHPDYDTFIDDLVITQHC
ncbi:hypothetical protein [Dactylosporangium darangshiense]|uniref:Uncharacterized protein n=1 Tax=Dactylosporangium darangshiense TaxID=579108 RepID=A0ABP8DMA9_9ACTN